MLFNLRDIKNNYQVIAENEEFGEIRSFVIDSVDWMLRYLVLRVGSRDLLLSTYTFGRLEPDDQVFPLLVSREKVMNSPEINLDMRLSREMERQLFDYYDWPYDWEQDDVPATMPGDLSAIPLIEMELDREQQLVPNTGEANDLQYLHSTEEIFGYRLEATNDNHTAGTLRDFIIDDETWRVMYMIVETNGILPGGRKVALPPSWVQKVDEQSGQILVNLGEETIKDIPEFRSIDDLKE